MLSGATLRASEMAGTAVFKMVVSSDSIKNATATSQGSNRMLDGPGGACEDAAALELRGIIFIEPGRGPVFVAILRDQSANRQVLSIPCPRFRGQADLCYCLAAFQ